GPAAADGRQRWQRKVATRDWLSQTKSEENACCSLRTNVLWPSLSALRQRRLGDGVGLPNSMHPQWRFGDEDLQLLEIAQQSNFQFRDEVGAALPAKIDSSRENDLIEIESLAAKPDAAQRKLALLRRHPAKALAKSPLES